MTKQAKIVAMTCTHAALKRREFLDLAFSYDNLLMEEAGQILEIETFIPMLLQKQVRGRAAVVGRLSCIGGVCEAKQSTAFLTCVLAQVLAACDRVSLEMPAFSAAVPQPPGQPRLQRIAVIGGHLCVRVCSATFTSRLSRARLLC